MGCFPFCHIFAKHLKGARETSKAKEKNLGSWQSLTARWETDPHRADVPVRDGATGREDVCVRTAEPLPATPLTVPTRSPDKGPTFQAQSQEAQ